MTWRLRAAVLLVVGLAPAAARAWNGNPRLRGGPGHPLPFGVRQAAPAGAHLTYYGGPVVSSVQVVMVLWGPGTYQPFVQQTTSPSVATFYAGITASPYFDWLSEYDTTVVPAGGGRGTQQRIGRGSFLARYAITPSAAASGRILDDTVIAAELAAQVAAGDLPAPAVDASGFPTTVYMLHFPKGKSITLGGSGSCVTGGFCAYHNTVQGQGQDLSYGVLPDMSSGSGCDTGCGGGAPFDNQTEVASHELIEAVTDPAVGLAVATAPPLAWYDPTNGEIGDICNGTQASVLGGDGVTYVVQRQWSNAAGACVATRPPPPGDFSIAVEPPARELGQGADTTFAISTAVTGGAAQVVSLSATGLGAGLAGAFSPTSVTAGGGATLTVSAGPAAATQTTIFTVTGRAVSGSHSALASVTVTVPAPAPVIAGSGGGGGKGGGGCGAGSAGWFSTLALALAAATRRRRGTRAA